MHFEEIHNIGQLMELIDRVGFLPLLNSGISGFSAEESAAMLHSLMAAGSGLYGSGRALLLQTAATSMESSLLARQGSLAASGGQISATIAVAFIPCQTRIA